MQIFNCVCAFSWKIADIVSMPVHAYFCYSDIVLHSVTEFLKQQHFFDIHRPIVVQL